MKKLFLIITALLAIATGAKADVTINSENFPDANFRNYLLSQEYGRDGKLTDAEIAGITSLNLRYQGIASLRGIKYFTALKSLWISDNQISEAEMEHVVRELPKQESATMYAYNMFGTNERNYMSYLQWYVAIEKGWNALIQSDPINGVWTPMIGYLPLSPTIVAVYIDEKTFPDANFRQCLIGEGYGCQCTSLNQRYLTFEDIEGITTLDIPDKDITSLTGIQFFTALEELDCSYNQLTALDVSKNTKLIMLYCNNNLLTALNVSKNTELEQLYCDENQIKGAAMDNLIVSLRPKVININKELKFAVVSNGNDEGNVCTKQQVNAAKNRGWTPYYYDYNLNKYKPYNGPYPKAGDVNNDNSVDVADISTVIDVMAGRAHWYKAAADVNDDGNMDVADVASIIDVMAGKTIVDDKVYTACPNDHHPHWIDLGLPSGTQWRCCNKGASTPEAYGGYYTFSETVSAPTAAQLRELVNECSSERTTLNGVWGKAFVGPNGGTIFLPASGYKDDEAVRDTGRDGKYWSETPFEAFGGSALSLYLNSIDTIEGIYRLTVRPVR